MEITGKLARQSPQENMQKLFDCIRPLLKCFLACLTFHRKEIRLRHLHKRTNPGSAPAVSSVSNVSGSNTTSTVEVSSTSVLVSTPNISVFNNLDGDRAVVPTTESEGRLNRMDDAIARLGSTLERFINNSTHPLSREEMTDSSDHI